LDIFLPTIVLDLRERMLPSILDTSKLGLIEDTLTQTKLLP